MSDTNNGNNAPTQDVPSGSKTTDQSQLGRITPRKVPASQAIPGNAEHAALIARQRGQQADPNDWGKAVNTSLRRPAMIGGIIVAVFVFLFTLWAAAAPISGASVAQGVVAANGQNIRVQHLEGGIVKSIAVSEGDRVTKGQVLLHLDPTSALANNNRYAKALIAMRANVERLEAERDGTDMAFSEALLQDARDTGQMTALNEQKREFEKRSERHASETRMVEQQVVAVNQQLLGLEAQIHSTKQQMKVLGQEIAVKEKLLKRQLTPRSQVLALRRQRAGMEGQLGGLTARMGETRTSALRLEEQKLRLRAQRSETAVAELNDVRARLGETEELARNAADIFQRTAVISPADGVVVTLNVNSPGAVVQQAEDIAIILPKGNEGDALIVEARLTPQDVDAVHVGQNATMRFSALNARRTPEVTGTVTYVAADRQLDPVTNIPFYTARLAIADTLPTNLKREQIVPGMPVETYIETGSRSFMDYLLKPLTDSMSRAFREE